MKTKFWFASTALAAMVAVAGCQKGGDETAPPPATSPSTLEITTRAGGSVITSGKWSILFDEPTKILDFIHNGTPILKGVSARAKVAATPLSSTDYPTATIEHETIGADDLFGEGERLSILYSGLAGRPDMRHDFWFYPARDHFFTAVSLSSASGEVSSNYLAPIYTETRSDFLPSDDQNRVLRVPFDNDSWVSYLALPLRQADIAGEDTSVEVTAIFNGRSRKGLIIGSVDHDTWKTGIRYKADGGRYIDELECFSGLIHRLTRDIADPNKTWEDDRKVKHPKQFSISAHGSVKGTTVRSARMMVGLFDDWRRGMESFGEACATVAPPRRWSGGTPFGWNSWAAMETKVNYNDVIAVSNYIKDELQPRGFENDGVTYIGLDSFWNDNFSERQLSRFVMHCRDNGQRAGIYWTPFSDWAFWPGRENDPVPGTNGQWRYGDLYLRGDGKYRAIESRALDPTHPGTRQHIDYQASLFRRLGFSYVKLDFLNNAALEADKFYDSAVTTGTQAYNEGMKYLSEACGDDMFLALSIAPIFPTRWGSSRRISCDTWGEMRQAGGPYEGGVTGYMLNSLSYGWWLDRLYPYNDSDHLLFKENKGDEWQAPNYQEGANRARVTSAVITGIYMLGDDLSSGKDEARRRTLAVSTNEGINDIARTGRSFRPVEGAVTAQPWHGEQMYVLTIEDCTWLAVFNFSASAVSTGTVALERLGLAGRTIEGCTELWKGSTVAVQGGQLSYSVPRQDVRVYKLNHR